MKLEMCSAVGPPFPETIGRLPKFSLWFYSAYFQCSGWILTIVEPLESLLVNVLINIQFID